MKFKRLPATDLEALKKDFIQFLVSNTITADDWEKIKKEDISKAEELIDMFSDIVYEKVMGKIEYLDFRSPSEIRFLHLKEDAIDCVGLLLEEGSTLDLTDANTIKKFAKGEFDEGIQIYTTEKPYTKEKSVEVFNLLESGHYAIDEKLFHVMKHLALDNK